jgi:tRNA threonylcarbamoyladenosine biosynthesis protein TsaE
VTEPAGSTPPLVTESDGVGETRSLAAALAGLCRAGDLVLLVGDLGAGKTTFAGGFGRALGITEPVTSPTFTLVRRYPVGPLGSSAPGASASGASGASAASGRGIRALVHADVYRLDTLGEIADLGLPEEIEDGGVALVEWGDVAVGLLGPEWLSVRFEIADDDRRRITLLGTGPSWMARWAQLGAAVGALGSGATPDTGAPLEEAAGR